jgi:hypothetical protein
MENQTTILDDPEVSAETRVVPQVPPSQEAAPAPVEPAPADPSISIPPPIPTEAPAPAPQDNPVQDFTNNSGWQFAHGRMTETRGMVIHHTGGGGDVNGVIDTLHQRNLSVQFVVDRDGKTYQLMPDGAKARHMLPGWGKGAGFSNDNLEGVEVIARDDKDVDAQKQAVLRLVQQRSQKFGYDPKTGVYGHGEVNPGHKEADEGMSSVALIRGGASPVTQKTAIPSDVKDILDEAAERTGVDKALLYNTARQESSFNPKAPNGGLFQFKPKTWAFAMSQWGDLHGIPSNASPTDPRANAILGAEWLKYVQQKIVSVNGEAKPGEIYLGHFLGPTGGANLIKLARQNPDAPAASYFPQAASANRSVFYFKDGTPKTAQQVYDWGVKIGGGSPQQFVASGTSSTPGQPVYAPTIRPTEISGEQEVTARDFMNRRDQEGSYMRLMSDTFKYDTIPGMALGTKLFTPDPSSIPPAQETLTSWRKAGVPDDIIQATLPKIVSKDAADFYFQRAQEMTKARENLSSLGWTGAGLSLLEQMLDPVAITAGAATGFLGDAAVVAAGGGKLARIATQAAGGMGANFAVEGAASALGNPDALQHPALTAAFGAAFGAVGGALGRNPHTQDQAAEVLDMANRQIKGLPPRDLNASTALTPASGGAAFNPTAEAPVVTDAMMNAVRDGAIPYTAMGLVRWDLAGKLKSSPNTFARWLGGALFDDPVGHKDYSPNYFSASMDKEQRRRVGINQMLQTQAGEFSKWAEEQGFNGVTKYLHYGDFAEAVSDAAHGIKTAQPVSPAVGRAAGALKQFLQEDARDLQNPWRDEGLLGRSYPNFEAGAPVQDYFPHIPSASKHWQLIDAAQDGNGVIKAWTRGALESAAFQRGKPLDKDLLDRWSEGVAVNSQKRANGVYETFERAQQGDFDGIAGLMRDAGIRKTRSPTSVRCGGRRRVKPPTLAASTARSST